MGKGVKTRQPPRTINAYLTRLTEILEAFEAVQESLQNEKHDYPSAYRMASMQSVQKAVERYTAHRKRVLTLLGEYSPNTRIEELPREMQSEFPPLTLR